MTPIPLRTVRPFVIDEVRLSEAAEAEGFDLNDRTAVAKFLKEAVDHARRYMLVTQSTDAFIQVDELIIKANSEWDERNERAKRQGQEKLPRMLPLIRLKVRKRRIYVRPISYGLQVDTTGVTETINPVRLSQEFHDRVANPRDVFVFHRAKQSRGAKVVMEKPELSIDDPDLTNDEKLDKVRMHTLVQEYLGAQQVQVLAEPGMSEALEKFMSKDDIHSFER